MQCNAHIVRPTGYVHHGVSHNCFMKLALMLSMVINLTSPQTKVYQQSLIVVRCEMMPWHATPITISRCIMLRLNTICKLQETSWKMVAKFHQLKQTKQIRL